MKIFLLSVFLSIFGIFASYSQNFEGRIDVVKRTLSDTLYYSYTIKNNFIRIDEYDTYKRLKQFYIINIKDSTITALNPNQKLYSKVDVQQLHANKQSDYDIINTGIYKYINGYKCYQWRVRNKSQNSEISYWIASDSFNFYTPMAGISAYIDDSFLAFMSLPTNTMKGEMPMLIESRTLLRVEKSSHIVTNITRSHVDLSLFSIPNFYQNYQVSR
ncbi:MAG TPA: DUF4412 domain-containing protein [Bacteroidales bacterium]|mgnify:CR=1 FL=1|nr:MAG: hypothetical protein BWY22_00376 [Bacteroidetes bacterium ADurb.Bin217]HPM12830.1 DUF4412 domain-containing protein [Bacteroidales bacterium]